MAYKLLIIIYPKELDILDFQITLEGSTLIQELYVFVLETYRNKIHNQIYTQWISKVNGLGKFAYVEGQTISNIFGSMQNGQLSIFTEPDKVPKDSELDILQTEDDKPICVSFMLIDGSNGVTSSLEYQCKPSTLFSDGINALFNFKSYTQGTADFQFEKDGKQLIFDQKTTFRQLNIVSNTILKVKTRWTGGCSCGDQLKYSIFQKCLH